MKDFKECKNNILLLFFKGGFTYDKGCSSLANGGVGCYGSLTSPHISARAGWKCLQFWYYISKGRPSSLQVTLISNDAQMTLLTSTKAGIWTFARLPIIPSSDSYQVSKADLKTRTCRECN